MGFKPSERGLTRVPSWALRQLLSAVFRGVVNMPLSVDELTRLGLQAHATDLMAHLRGLDTRSVHAVLVAVIAEREAASVGAGTD